MRLSSAAGFEFMYSGLFDRPPKCVMSLEFEVSNIWPKKMMVTIIFGCDPCDNRPILVPEDYEDLLQEPSCIQMLRDAQRNEGVWFEKTGSGTGGFIPRKTTDELCTTGNSIWS